ncbi:uncharacterized protein LOC117900650 [Drosophila subobscura]|uniref:uncharacterized protein LOC117900650 n=1 Tax=Drosophila subobscura TaxID=7241 RepID=UPI00155AB7DF|nr:uncharacterized protein LOC117900650 [Drosophila subobscura]
MFLPAPNQTCQRHQLTIIGRYFFRQLRQMSQLQRTSYARTAFEQFQSPALCQRHTQAQAFTPNLVAMQRSQQFGEDYRIYQQNIDLDSFFGEEPKYDRVSDVCLLNDHFILVKMPQVQFQPPKPMTPQTKSKLPRCFKCNRSSRVSPILEDVEEKPPPRRSCLKPWASRDMDEVEVFNSTTTSSAKATPESVIVEQPHPQRQSPPLPAPLQLEAVHPAASTQQPLLNRGPLHWFLWPFRRRLHARAKSKSQLAAVHKTYFVRWSKPPDTIWQGYGVDRGDREQKSSLRRCRSAVF